MSASTCPNCGASTDGVDYCPSCGQKNAGLPTVRELFGQFLDDVFSLDSRIARSYALLVARPGELTAQYLRGRRARYVRPLRMYLVNSLLYFLIASWAGEAYFQADIGEDPGRDGEVDTEQVARALSTMRLDEPERQALRRALADADSSWVAALASDDSLDAVIVNPSAFPLIGDHVSRQVSKVEAMDDDEFQRRINDGIVRNLPKAFFLLVPVFAWLLAVVYRRQRRRYAEHFVFALHGHALAFLVLAVTTAIGWDPLALGITAAFAIHAVLALRRVYAQPWWKTVIKAGLLSGAYAIFLAFAVAATAAVSFLTI